MHLSRNFLEKAGPDVMALSVLTHMRCGDLREASTLAEDAAHSPIRGSYGELNALAAVTLERAGSLDAALTYWGKALEAPDSRLKWLEAAMRAAWRMGTEEAAECAAKWQKLLENLYSEVPSLTFLLELEQHGWKGKGTLGIFDGQLRGWLWLDRDEKPSFECDTGSELNFSLTLRPTGEISGKRLYTVKEPIPQKEFGIALRDGNGDLIQGCPVWFSPPATAQRQNGPGASLTILIPVYGDRDATLACIASVLASRKKNRTETDIRVIWDCGNDQRLLLDLRRLAQKGKIRLFENPVNMGFLASVNRGMGQIKSGHILLLNADTLVHGDWIDRMMAIAARKGAATVTALSNNAELMAFPSKSTPGKIASLAQTRIMDKAAATLDPDESAIEIPTGVGFCMLITRAALNRIGGLDGTMLFRGYGEEVEFCLRARDAGMVNYGAFNVFVGHRGERSFGAAKQALAYQNNQVIFRKYPEHRQEYGLFLAGNAGKELRRKISLEVTKYLQKFLRLELRPWSQRELQPWKRDKEDSDRDRSAILFIKAGRKPRALLRIVAELPVADMEFDVVKERELLRNALQDLRFGQAANFLPYESALKLLEDIGISGPEAVEIPLVEGMPQLSAVETICAAPPISKEGWRGLCMLARENPATLFYVFDLDKLWAGVPRPANVYPLEQPSIAAVQNAKHFLLPDNFCDTPAWRQWLQRHGGKHLTFCKAASDG